MRGVQITLSQNGVLQRWLVPGLLGLTLLITDQFSKLWMVAILGPEPLQREINLIGDWLRLIYTRNTGIAFGLFPSLAQIFIVTSILITAGALYAYVYHLPNEKLAIQIAIGLIAGGALGNISDRLRLGYVVDFISVGWWPVFNLADSSVTIGVMILAIYLMFASDAPAPRSVPQDDGLLRDLLNQEVK